MTATSTSHDTSPISAARAVDADGRVWRHDHPIELYRWVSRRDELLRTIAAAPGAGRVETESAGGRHANARGNREGAAGIGGKKHI